MARAKREELKQRGEGRAYGPYRLLNIGGTTLKALKERGLIPQRDYEGSQARKPDMLILDQRSKDVRVVAAVEYKDDLFRDDGVSQAATMGALLGAKYCITTDNAQSSWFLSADDGAFNPILDETGLNFSKLYVSPDASVSPDLISNALAAVEEVDLKLHGNRLQSDKALNPTALAKSVWQDIYTAGDYPTPERALATFVEIFMFKFLSDLGVLDEDESGHELSFGAVFKKSDDKCLKYYTDTVRPYIKNTLFPPGSDGTTILNGFAFDHANRDHNHVFKKVLRKFKNFEADAENGGLLIDIDREFKSRLYEEFLKGSVGQRSLGQFFTPRRLMGGIVDMAEVEALPSGARVADPACGVGGFPMETAARRARLLGSSDFPMEVVDGQAVIRPRIEYRGFDKGSSQTESLAIILAKANFVIYQSELLKKAPNATRAMSGMFNTIFRAYSDTSLGSLVEIQENYYDLILSNPPYVASGARNLKEAAERSGVDYSAGGKGVEALFVEKMLRELRPGGRAFIIIPDGLLLRGQPQDRRLRDWITKTCFVDALVSLPVKTFFATPKKTYILAVTKKNNEGDVQKHPVFAYMVSSIGETLDANRFATSENDMPDLARRFRQFRAILSHYGDQPAEIVEEISAKVKYIPLKHVTSARTWIVDKFWSPGELINLGLDDVKVELSEDEFYEEIRAVRDQLSELLGSSND